MHASKLSTKLWFRNKRRTIKSYLQKNVSLKSVLSFVIAGATIWLAITANNLAQKSNDFSETALNLSRTDTSQQAQIHQLRQIAEAQSMLQSRLIELLEETKNQNIELQKHGDYLSNQTSAINEELTFIKSQNEKINQAEKTQKKVAQDQLVDVLDFVSDNARLLKSRNEENYQEEVIKKLNDLLKPLNDVLYHPAIVEDYRLRDILSQIKSTIGTQIAIQNNVKLTVENKQNELYFFAVEIELKCALGKVNLFDIWREDFEKSIPLSKPAKPKKKTVKERAKEKEIDDLIDMMTGQGKYKKDSTKPK